MTAVVFQIVQLVLVVAAAPLLTGVVRLVKARLNGRRGPSPLQPYRDLARLLRKDVLVTDTASWLFQAAPYAVFVLTWLAASLVPTFATGFALAPAADLILLAGLLGTARAVQALAALDTGTAFGGIGASREMMIAALAEPAMLMVVLSLAILVGTTAAPAVVEALAQGSVGVRVSLALALVTLVMVALAETGRVPIDNPATHLELTMVHEAMVLEYGGRHLALIELAGMLRLLLFVSLIGAVFVPWTLLPRDGAPAMALLGLVAYGAKLLVAAVLLGLFETSIAKMRVFRVAEFLGVAFLVGVMAAIFLFVSRGIGP